MAGEKEVLIRIRAVEDDLVESLDKIEKQSKDTAEASESAFEGIQNAAKNVAIVVTGINQALELVSKGFDLLKSSIISPLERLRDMVSLGGDFVRAYEDATETTTAAGAALNELDRNFGRLKATIGGAIASTPEFTAVLEVANDRIDRTIDLIANNLPDVTAIFGAVIEFVAAGAVSSVEKIRLAFSILIDNIEEVVGVARKFGLFEDPLLDLAEQADATASVVGALGPGYEQLAGQIGRAAGELDRIVQSGEYTVSQLESIRGALSSLSAFSPTGDFQSDDVDAAIETLDKLIARARPAEEAGERIQTSVARISEGFQNLANAGGGDILSGITDSIRDAAARIRGEFARGGSGVDLKVAVRVDDDELERFQQQNDRARKSFDVLRQQLEQGVTPKFSGNVGDLLPQFEEIGEEIKQIFLSLPDDDLGLAQTFITATDAAKDFLASFGTNGVGPALEALDIVQDEIDALGESAPEIAARFEDLRDRIASVAEGIADVDGAEVEVRVQTSQGTDSPAEAATVLGSAIEEAGATAEESFGEAGQSVRDAADELASSTSAANAASNELSQSAIETSTAAAEGIEAARAIAVSAEQSTEAATAITDAGNAFADLLKSGNSAESGALLSAAGELRGAAGEQKGAARDLSGAADALSRAADRINGGGGGAKSQGYAGSDLDSLVTVLGQLLVSRFALTTEFRG